MALCDVCGAEGRGTLVGSAQVREAVLDNGFDPFKLGLIPAARIGTTPAAAFEHWKKTIVEHDVSDWDLCPRCFAAIRPHFQGEPMPTGVSEAQVPLGA